MKIWFCMFVKYLHNSVIICSLAFMAVCFDQPWTILISLICIDHSEHFRANVHNKVSGGFYGDALEVMVLHGHHLTESLHVWHIGLPDLLGNHPYRCCLATGYDNGHILYTYTSRQLN